MNNEFKRIRIWKTKRGAHLSDVVFHIELPPLNQRFNQYKNHLSYTFSDEHPVLSTLLFAFCAPPLKT